MANFDNGTKKLVWEKWEITSWNDKNIFRKDDCWAWIAFAEYWNRESNFWWEIDHIKADSNWWSDSIYNLRPLHWKNNLKTSDW